MLFDFPFDIRIRGRDRPPAFPDFPGPPLDTRLPPDNIQFPLGIVPAPAPVPVPPPSSPGGARTTNFPIGGPAANDPDAGRRILGRLFRLGRFGLVGVAAAVLQEIAEQQIERELEELEEAERVAEEQRAADAQEPREVIINEPAIPESEPLTIPPRPEFEPFPSAPPSTLPELEPVTPNLPSEFPSQIPDVPPVTPSPPTLPRPFPQPTPGGNPVRLPRFPNPDPGPFPGGFPLGVPTPSPSRRPAGLPLATPRPGLRPGTPNLTPPNPGGVGSVASNFNPNSALAVAGLNLQRCPQRKCKKDEDKPRRKCFKKLVKEGITPSRDESFNWTEIDCLTGREL